MSKLMWRKSLAGSYDVKLDDGHCIANIGVGKDWLTVYLIETEVGHRGTGEATRLLLALQDVCNKKDGVLRVWCPMNAVISQICAKLNIEIV